MIYSGGRPSHLFPPVLLPNTLVWMVELLEGACAGVFVLSLFWCIKEVIRGVAL